ncbi:MAG: hypothetical protein WCO09_05140 [bacterium]
MNDKQRMILALSITALVVGMFSFVCNNFFEKYYQEQENSISVTPLPSSNVNNNLPVAPDPKVRPWSAEDLKSLIKLDDGSQIVAEVVPPTSSTSTGTSSDLNILSKISLFDSKGVLIKQLYKYYGSLGHLVLHKLSSDKSRLYFYIKPDGLGGYYPIPRIFARKFFEYDMKKGTTVEITIPNSSKIRFNNIDDVSDDGNIVSFVRDTSTSSLNMIVSLLYRKENKIVDLSNFHNDGFLMAGGSRFLDNTKIVYYVAFDNPDKENVKLIEYDLVNKTYGILKQSL